MQEIRSLLERTKNHAANYIEGLNSNPIAASVDASTLRVRLGRTLEDQGTSAEKVIDELVDATEGGHLGSASGRFFAWVIGGALPSALAADWLTSTWDNNAALYACGPASSVVEEIAGSWILEVLNLPSTVSFAFTTGCQMAHFTCLAAARHALIRLPTDQDSRVTAEAFTIELQKSNDPTIVVLDAADLNVGAIDPFDELIPIARKANAWVHVDGAFGLWARASERHCNKLNGVELAHSWATDAHKWLNTPKDIGFAAITDREAHRAAMSISANYLTQDGDTRDQIDYTPDWTRRARGFAVYAALRELGRNGVADLVDRCCEHASSLAYGISALTGAELVAAPTLNQALVRFLSPKIDATHKDHDEWTDSIIEAINAEGTAFFSGTTWQGRRAMRISVVNWRTTSEDVALSIDAISRVLSNSHHSSLL